MPLRLVPIEEEIQQPHFPDLLEKTLINLLFTGSWFSHIENSYFKQYDLTVGQYNILRILRGQKGQSISISAVRDRMLERNPDLTRTLDRLIRKQLIRRETSAADRRQAELFITPEGEALLKEIGETTEHFPEGLKALTDAEMNALNALLDKARAR